MRVLRFVRMGGLVGVMIGQFEKYGDVYLDNSEGNG